MGKKKQRKAEAEVEAEKGKEKKEEKKEEKGKKEKEEEDREQALALFREKANLLEKDRNDDATCFRFLRARQYNVDKAVTMYNAYVEWRAKNDVDSVLATPFAVDKNVWHHSFHGRDKMGRPIFIERTGSLDVKSMINKGYTMETLIRAHIHQQEYMAQLAEEASKHEGRSIEQTLSILDLEGAGVWVHLNGYAREFFTILSGIAQNYYPERLGKLVVINAPRAFPMAWSFVKPLLDVNTQNKIIMPSYSHQTKVLLELVDPIFIPKKFGGLCPCDERGCFTNPNPDVFVDALRYNEGPTSNGEAEGDEDSEKGEGLANSQELLAELSAENGTAEAEDSGETTEQGK